MPIYEYRCPDCGLQNEYLQKVSEPPMTVCPSCGKESLQKLLSHAGFQLKGSGWYATDFKHGGAKPSEKKPEAKSEAKTEAKSEAKTEAKSEAKTEAKAEAKTETKTKAKTESVSASS
ncbi:MAG: FmdB family zinc ribbon protein [Burkholderiales bacterium]